MINHSGKEYEKLFVYVCICLYVVCMCAQLNHFALQLKLAQHCKLAIIQ